MGIRKNIKNLTTAEKDTYVKAILKLKNTVANPGDPIAQQISLYDQFVAIHMYVNSILQSGFSANDRGHAGSGFLPWHRKFLIEYETKLQSMVPGESLTLPYWDWTDTAGEDVLTDVYFMGPHGTTGVTYNNEVTDGYFAFDPPGTTGHIPTPSWWVAAGLTSFPGWRIRSDESTATLGGNLGTTLRRGRLPTPGSHPFSPAGIGADVKLVMAITNFETSGTNLGFSTVLEAGHLSGSGTPITTTQIHGAIHGAVSGQMTYPMISVNDPIFFLHHCNVDRLWAMWQINGHQGAAFGPAATGNPQGHKLNDPMWPWVASPADYSSTNAQPNIVLPVFPLVNVTPNDMLDHRSLGYSYDTEVVLGVALDQTGSMTGPTPISTLGPITNPTKWDAAKRGVESLLLDCETIFDSLEAYITVGIETFRNLGTNTFTPIFTGTPYGLVKNGSSYSSAVFDTNIAAQVPGGGTPLAGALTDTETNLVRPPFGNLPANDNRYLAILTDGIETASPLLSTLSAQPTPAFPDTMIFAMGFGMGGGWNGVDYTAIDSIVAKGKAAPPGAKQAYHGDSQVAIDKFYTDTIARTIDYTSTIDPIYELFPGEHVDTAFDVTDADSSFMITCQGYDYSDKNWDFCIVRPNGEHCADTMEGMHNDDHAVMELDPFDLTSRMKNGRCTIILKRNGVDSSLWVGRWNLRAMYKMDSDMKMYMPLIGRIILPTGSPPVRGPLYARLNQKRNMRQAVRIIPRTAKDPVFQIDQAPANPSDEACEVSVNIYSKTTIQSSLEVDIKAPFAGNDFKIILRVSDRASSVIGSLNVVAARLVAPKHSIGNAFADLKIIPLEDRKKYLTHNVSNHPFNEAQYLADYEQKKPGIFPVRDESIVFTKVDAGLFHANIGNNVFPGVHRIAVYVEGTIIAGKDQQPQLFNRILQTEVSLGINPDPNHSKPSLSWLSPNKFLVSVTPTDKLGNIASPARMPAPVITVNGIAVKGKHINPFTGEHQVEITLEGKGIKLSSDGRSILEGEATIETDACEKLSLKKGDKFDAGILISGRPLVSSIQNIRQKKD